MSNPSGDDVPARPALRLQRAVTGRLQRWDTEIAQKDGGREAQGPGILRRDSVQRRLVRTETRGRLQRQVTQRLPLGAEQSENAPPVVMAKNDLGAANWRHALVAPLSGMVAGAIEISLLWPTEWAKVQRQLRRGDANFSVLRTVLSIVKSGIERQP
eukprot:g6664.t1